MKNPFKKRKERKAEDERLVKLLTDSLQMLSRVYEADMHPLNRIVHFFQGTSQLQDELPLLQEFFKRKFRMNKAAKNQVDFLIAEIQKGGRDPHGMNRSPTGSPVTAEHVYVGGNYGLNTATVAYWRHTEFWDPDYRTTYGGHELKNPITAQAKNFVDGYRKLYETLRDIVHQLN